MAIEVLLIDDDPEYSAALTAMLRHRGMAVRSAESGEAGIALARAQRPDIILLDNMMGHHTEGIQTAQALKRDPDLKRVPILMITATRETMNLPFALKPASDWLPVEAVLDKPVPIDTLLDLIQRHVPSDRSSGGAATTE